jgi:RND family efflux transporter, MFP subunit
MKKISKSKILIIVLLVGILIFLATISCKRKKPATVAAAPPKISVTKPIVRPIVLYKSYPGYLKSYFTVDLVARVSGFLQEQHFTPGETVKQNQLLFVIEPDVYQDALSQAESNVTAAEATYDYAQNNYQRMQEAAASDAISQIDLIQAYTDVNTAKANLSGSKAAFNTAKTNLGYCYIKAPFKGDITVNQVDVGNYISGSLSPVTLATLYDNSKMFAYFNIEDNQYLAMRMTSKDKNLQASLPSTVELSLPGSNYSTIVGVPDYISPSVELSTGALTLRALVDNKNKLLKNGMYVVVDLPYGQDESAILIQNAAIGTDQLGQFIYIVNDSNMVQYRHIETGQIIDDSLIQVLDGLDPNEEYVTKALLKVRSGMKVDPVIQ